MKLTTNLQQLTALGIALLFCCGLSNAVRADIAASAGPELTQEQLGQIYDNAAAVAAPKTGKEIYQKWCAICHAPGLHHPATNALTAKYKGVKGGVITEWTDLSPEVIRYFVRNGISVMPQFRLTEINESELEVLIDYLMINSNKARAQ